MIGNSLEIHPAILMVALIVASRFGFLWIILATPAVGIARGLFRYIYHRLQTPPQPHDVPQRSDSEPGHGDVSVAR